MNLRHLTALSALATVWLLTPQAQAAAMGEEQAMVPIGQGVSSPSFSSGLNRENPAGLTVNHSLKGDGQLGFNDGGGAHGAGALLVGNGSLGAGLQYSAINGNQINWGIAGKISALSVGFSGHHPTSGGDGYFDVGATLDLGIGLTAGLYIPNFTNHINRVGFGFTKTMTSNVDLGVDAGYYGDGGSITLNPALGIHLSPILISASYGFKLTGSQDSFYKKDFSAAIGLKVAQNVMLTYEYKGLIDHLISLAFTL